MLTFWRRYVIFEAKYLIFGPNLEFWLTSENHVFSSWMGGWGSGDLRVSSVSGKNNPPTPKHWWGVTNRRQEVVSYKEGGVWWYKILFYLNLCQIFEFWPCIWILAGTFLIRLPSLPKNRGPKLQNHVFSKGIGGHGGGMDGSRRTSGRFRHRCRGKMFWTPLAELLPPLF